MVNLIVEFTDLGMKSIFPKFFISNWQKTLNKEFSFFLNKNYALTEMFIRQYSISTNFSILELCTIFKVLKIKSTTSHSHF